MLLLAGILLFQTNGSAQLKLGVTPTAINKSSILELESKVQGLLLTRVPDTLVSPLMAAPDGTLIFFTKDNTLRIRKNGLWQQLADPTIFWKYNDAAGGDLAGTYPNPTVALSAITTTKLADLSVTTLKLADLNVTTNKLADLSVTTLKLADLSVTTNKLVDNSVTNLKLADNSVSTTKILNGNVTYAKIQDVTTNKLLGRYSTTNGSMQEITLGTGLALDNTTGILKVQNNLSNLQDVTVTTPASGNILLYDGTKWVNTSLNSVASTVWALGGNAVASEQKFGTTSNFDLPIITNNTEKMRVTKTGSVGIGTTAPAATLDVSGTVKLGTSGTPLKNVIKLRTGADASNTINQLKTGDPPATLTYSVPGATLGASVIVNPSTNNFPPGLIIAWSMVTSADVVSVTFYPYSVSGAIPMKNYLFDFTVINQ